MTDKAHIFTEITKRNALRREAGLPPLNIRAEYTHACAQAEWQAWEDQCTVHSDLYSAVREEVLAELRQTKGDPTFPQTMGGRVMVDALTIDGFERALARLGIHKPYRPVHNEIVYAEVLPL